VIAALYAVPLIGPRSADIEHSRRVVSGAPDLNDELRHLLDCDAA